MKKGNISTYDQHLITKNFEELVNIFEVRDPKSLNWVLVNDEMLKSHFDVRYFFLMETKLLTICPKANTSFRYDSLKLRYSGDNSILRIKFDKGYDEFVGMISTQLSNVAMVPFMSKQFGQVLTFSFNTIEARLLPAPYASNCYNYTTGLKARDFCMWDCIQDDIYAKRGYIAKNIFRHANDTRKPIGESDDEEFWNSKECNRKCERLDCYTNYVKAIRVGNEMQDDEQFNLVVKVGSILTTTQFFPHQSLNEYIVFLLGLVGMWLGLSVNDVLLYCFRRFHLLT